MLIFTKDEVRERSVIKGSFDVLHNPRVQFMSAKTSNIIRAIIVGTISPNLGLPDGSCGKLVRNIKNNE